MPTVPDKITSGRYRFNEEAGRYIAPNGRFVGRQAIRADLDRTLDSLSDSMAGVTQQLVDGSISPQQWQRQMADYVKRSQLVGGASYKGGWAHMTQADFGRVGQLTRRQYDYLRGFAEDIASGRQPLNGTAVRRARLYGQAARPTYYQFAQADMRRRGFDEERSILNPAEHCDLCVSEAARGFVPIGELVPIGGRTCRTNDRCDMEYRNSQSGETLRI